MTENRFFTTLVEQTDTEVGLAKHAPSRLKSQTYPALVVAPSDEWAAPQLAGHPPRTDSG